LFFRLSDTAFFFLTAAFLRITSAALFIFLPLAFRVGTALFLLPAAFCILPLKLFSLKPELFFLAAALCLGAAARFRFGALACFFLFPELLFFCFQPGFFFPFRFQFFNSSAGVIFRSLLCIFFRGFLAGHFFRDPLLIVFRPELRFYRGAARVILFPAEEDFFVTAGLFFSPFVGELRCDFGFTFAEDFLVLIALRLCLAKPFLVEVFVFRTHHIGKLFAAFLGFPLHTAQLFLKSPSLELFFFSPELLSPLRDVL